MPKMGDTMQEGTIAKWYKAVGDTIEEGEVIAEIETEKASIEIEAFESGPLTKIIVQEGETVPVGEPIAVIGDADASESIQAAPAEADPSPADSAGKAPPVESQARPISPIEPAGFFSKVERVVASPLARRLAMESNVDLHTVRGTGPGGRIVAEDVQAHAQGTGSRLAPPLPQTSAAPPTAAPAPGAPGEVWVNAGAPTQMRKVIARRLTESKQQIPHFYATIDVDMEAAMALREQLNARGEEFVKLSPNDVIIKAVADTLRAFPAMRVGWSDAGLLATDRVNVGVAVALPEGLIVPVVRDADRKPMNEIAGEIRALAEKARAGKLMPDEYAGGTFSVTSLGMFGIEEFMAIINPPEPAILAVGAISQVPVVKDGQVVPGTRMKLTLSCDHRIVDGAVGAQFLQELKRRLESPLLLLQ